jgi:hypothetical protein
MKLEEIADIYSPTIDTQIIDLKEIVDLIAIRQYVSNIINGNGYIDRDTVNYTNGILLLLDKKILGLLQTNEFKDYINYKDVVSAKIEAATINNIRSGLKK